MQITDVRIKLVKNTDSTSRLRALASITLDDEFAIHNIKVIEGEEGLFVAMPCRKVAEGEFRDVAHPIHAQAREKVHKCIIERYNLALAEED